MRFRVATAVSPRRRRFAAVASRRCLAIAVALIALSALHAPAAGARELKLWPLFDYTSDPSTGTTRLAILGPLVEYHGDPQYRRFAVRPLFSIRQARVGHDDEVRVLYPLITSRWQPSEQTTSTVGGLITYRTTTTTDASVLTGQHLRALPFYFYDWDGEHGARASVFPLYADLDDVAGFEHVRAVLFPAYLRLTQPDYERRWLGYPFYSDVGGPRGSGTAVWPVYGRMRVEGSYEGGFVGWPFYIWDERTRDGATERRMISFPFYSTVEGPHRTSVAYGTLLYVHTRNDAADVESFAFPWPVWEYQRRASTHAALTVRLLPFYDAVWASDETRTYRRTDGMLVLFHDERTTELATGKTAHVFALAPGVVDTGDDTWDRGGSPALADAMFPHDNGVRELYAPLWRLYGWDGPVRTPRLSIAWGAVTRDGNVTTYPLRWDPPDAPADASSDVAPSELAPSDVAPSD